MQYVTDATKKYFIQPVLVVENVYVDHNSRVDCDVNKLLDYDTIRRTKANLLDA